MSKMPKYYNNKYNENIKMASMYNKKNPIHKMIFFSNKSYLHNGQGSPNEFENMYKPFDLIKVCLFYSNIFILNFSPQYQ